MENTRTWANVRREHTVDLVDTVTSHPGIGSTNSWRSSGVGRLDVHGHGLHSSAITPTRCHRATLDGSRRQRDGRDVRSQAANGPAFVPQERSNSAAARTRGEVQVVKERRRARRPVTAIADAVPAAARALPGGSTEPQR